MSAKPKIASPTKSRRKGPGCKLPQSRRYHQVDDDATVFDYELPDWLVGAN